MFIRTTIIGSKHTELCWLASSERNNKNKYLTWHKNSSIRLNMICTNVIRPLVRHETHRSGTTLRCCCPAAVCAAETADLQRWAAPSQVSCGSDGTQSDAGRAAEQKGTVTSASGNRYKRMILSCEIMYCFFFTHLWRVNDIERKVLECRKTVSISISIQRSWYFVCHG